MLPGNGLSRCSSSLLLFKRLRFEEKNQSFRIPLSNTTYHTTQKKSINGRNTGMIPVKLEHWADPPAGRGPAPPKAPPRRRLLLQRGPARRRAPSTAVAPDVTLLRRRRPYPPAAAPPRRPSPQTFISSNVLAAPPPPPPLSSTTSLRTGRSPLPYRRAQTASRHCFELGRDWALSFPA